MPTDNQHPPHAQAAPTAEELATLTPEERAFYDNRSELLAEAIQIREETGINTGLEEHSRMVVSILGELGRLRLAARRALHATGLDDCTQHCPLCDAWARKCEALEKAASPRPFADAPRDGTPILAWDRHHKRWRYVYYSAQFRNWMDMLGGGLYASERDSLIYFLPLPPAPERAGDAPPSPRARGGA